MLRSQYDTDCITWSPQGRLFQVEYALEAVKQGSLCVALRSQDFVVLATLNRCPNKLALHQQKIYQVDAHLGLAFAGLTADGRLITKFMRTEALNHQYTFGNPINPGRLVTKIAEKSQLKTHRAGKRPYGVGCLVAGVDENGPHIYETCPDANTFEYVAHAIGARCQAAKTYLEKHFESFATCSFDQLLTHAVAAVRASAQGEVELVPEAVSVAAVGPGHPFALLSADVVASKLAETQAQAMAVDL